MRPWLLIGMIGVAVAVGIGIVEIASGSQDSNVTQSVVESTGRGISDVNLEEANEIPHEEQIFVPEVPPDPQVKWFKENQWDLEQGIRFNEMSLNQIYNEIEYGISNLRNKQLLSARSAFWSAESKLKSFNRLSPVLAAWGPPSGKCDTALRQYDVVTSVSRLDWNLGSIDRVIGDLEFQLSGNGTMDDVSLRDLEIESSAVIASFNALVQDHNLAAQNLISSCSAAKF